MPDSNRVTEIDVPQPMPRFEETRGGYSGSTDADKVPPPAKIPSGSIEPQTSKATAAK